MVENTYIISNGNRHIGCTNHEYFITEKQKEAYGWKKRLSAENVLTHLKKNHGLLSANINKDNYKVIENWKQGEIKINSMKDHIETISNLNCNNLDEIPLGTDLDNLLIILCDLENKLKINKAKYESDLIKVSKALTDIDHFKEFNPKRSASARCKLDVFETKILIRRRELKNNILKAECALEILKGKKIEPNIGKKYEVRILDNLFKTGIVPDFDEWWKEK